MSQLVPNLEALLAALPPGSPGAGVAATFDAATLPAARGRLRALVATWEQPSAEPSAAPPVPAEEDAV